MDACNGGSSMNLDTKAVRKAYPEAASIISNKGAFKADGTEITLEQSKIDAARVELDKLKYKEQRRAEYPPVVDQLDDIYHNGIDGWKATIKATKDKYPKS